MALTLHLTFFVSMCRVGRGTTLLRRFVRRCFSGASYVHNRHGCRWRVTFRISRYAAASALAHAGAKEQLQRLEAIMGAAEVIAGRGWMSKVWDMCPFILFLLGLSLHCPKFTFPTRSTTQRA